MIVRGIDLTKLKGNALNTFDCVKNGKTLILDGDGLCYEASATSAKLETAVRRAAKRVLELKFLTRCEFVRVHLTAKGCKKAGRGLLVGAAGAYQNRRAGKPKPPLLEQTRTSLTGTALFDEEDGVSVFLHHDIEADDAMMMDAYSIPNTLTYSPDKDLRIVPSDWYDVNTGKTDTITDRFGWIGIQVDKNKVVGHGTKFFWAQMLMGDTADTVKGILKYDGKACGPAGAFKALQGCVTEDEAANKVLDAYREIDQNPLPEAGMLWLLRTREDTAEGYIWSLGLSEENRAFIADCYNRPYKNAVQEPDEDTPPWELEDEDVPQ